MKKIITSFILFTVVSISGFAQQNNTQQELYEDSKKIAYQVMEKMNLDEDEFVFLTRAIHSYKTGMHKISLSIKSGASNLDVTNYTDNMNEQLKSYLNDMFPNEKSSKLYALVSEILKD